VRILPEIIESNTLGRFLILRIKIFLGPPPQLGCALARFRQSLAHVVKISGRNIPLRAEI